MKKLDLQHWLVLLLTPCASAFLDYLVNSAAPFSKMALQHAGLATCLVAVAIVDKDLRAKMAGAAAFLVTFAATVSTIGAGFVLFASLEGCSGAAVAPTAPSKPVATASTQALARGAVDVAKHLWIDAADACSEYAASQDREEGLQTLQKCKNALLPARDSLIAAATAFDAWNDASKEDIACAVSDVVDGVSRLSGLLHPTPTEKALIADAAELSRVLGCERPADGGAQ